jgi:hypothetical protein
MELVESARDAERGGCVLIGRIKRGILCHLTELISSTTSLTLLLIYKIFSRVIGESLR